VSRREVHPLRRKRIVIKQPPPVSETVSNLPMAGGNETAFFGMLEARESATEARWGSCCAYVAAWRQMPLFVKSMEGEV